VIRLVVEKDFSPESNIACKTETLKPATYIRKTGFLEALQMLLFGIRS